MEYLFLFIILYFILRTAGNLVRLLRGEEASGSSGTQRADSPARRSGWEGPSPRNETGTAREEPTFWGNDIEDATWRDLDDGPDRPNAPR
jgi:hypothetical protein